MKCYWIGERSELYIGKCPQTICDHYKCESMQEDINNGNFGEITNVELVIEFDDGSKETIKDFLKCSDNVSQISSAYC